MPPNATRLQLTELLIAVAVVVGALIWAERAAWRQIGRLRSSMTTEQLTAFRSAERLRSAILEVRSAWRDGGPVDVAASRARERMAEQINRTASGEERRLGGEIRAAFDAYVQQIANATNRAPHEPVEVRRALEHALTLTDQLAALNESGAQAFVLEANGALTRLQRFLFVSLIALLAAGAVIVLLAYQRTIAPLRNTLTENRATIERQEKLASLGVFATGIAHEIRNPLTAIKVRLFSLKASHRPGTSERDDTEVIESEIERLERIVRDFLQFARPADPVRQTMPSANLLSTTSELLASELAKRSIRLKLEIEADKPVSVDADKMKQVLINFIQNAADSMEPGGVVTLRSRLDKQSLQGRIVPAVVLDIVDTGKGMPPEVQRRLFDPFFTTKENGTGLGLPISARIVEKHGGVIQYKSHPGRGTTFSIVLPLAQTDENES